jgi:O-6-methylguanine DNA methyltransferase
MAGWVAHVARVHTMHGSWWMAWGDDGLVSAARRRLDAVARARAAGAGAVQAAAPASAPAHPDWSRMPGGFRGRALRACHSIPPGACVTYGELARRAGSPGAARAAGSAMATNPLPVVIPCHRVVRADGAPGAYSAGGPAVKTRMLMAEGALPPAS